MAEFDDLLVPEHGVNEPADDDPRRSGRRHRTRGLGRATMYRCRSLATDLRSFQGLMLLTCLVLCVAPVSIAPGQGVDLSWVTALNVARQDGLHFGRDLLFTYGPWGYLDSPLAVSRFDLVTGMVFLAFALSVAWFALRAALSRVIRRDLAAIAAAAILVLTTPAGGASAILVLGVTLTVLDYVGLQEHDSAAAWIPRGGAACAAFLLELKFSEGVFLSLVVAACCVFGPKQKLLRAIEAVAIYIITALAAWVLAGQSLRDLPRWLDKSLEISRAYSNAMATDFEPNLFNYFVLVGVILVVIGYVARMSRTHDRRRTVGILVVTAIVIYLGFREGTGRHDSGHEVYFYLWAIPTLVWFIAIARSRVFRAAILVIAVVLASNNYLNTNLPVVRTRWEAATEVVLKSSYQTAFLTSARNTAQISYGVPFDMRLAVAGHPVAIDGAEDAVAWAYDFDWRPAPVFQSYVAFTADLDAINARWLRDSPADQMILRPTITAIDGRNSLWDPPQYVLAEMCNLDVKSASDKWLLLEKGLDRCGASTGVSSMHVTSGQQIQVPQVGPSKILTMSFDADSSGLLVDLGRDLNKSFTPLEVHTDQTSFRVPSELASGPLVLSYPAKIDWPTAFSSGAPYQHVAFSESGTVHFNAIDFS